MVLRNFIFLYTIWISVVWVGGIDQSFGSSLGLQEGQDVMISFVFEGDQNVIPGSIFGAGEGQLILVSEGESEDSPFIFGLPLNGLSRILNMVNVNPLNFSIFPPTDRVNSDEDERVFMAEGGEPKTTHGEDNEVGEDVTVTDDSPEGGISVVIDTQAHRDGQPSAIMYIEGNEYNSQNVETMTLDVTTLGTFLEAEGERDDSHPLNKFMNQLDQEMRFKVEDAIVNFLVTTERSEVPDSIEVRIPKKMDEEQALILDREVAGGTLVDKHGNLMELTFLPRNEDSDGKIVIDVWLPNGQKLETTIDSPDKSQLENKVDRIRRDHPAWRSFVALSSVCVGMYVADWIGIGNMEMSSWLRRIFVVGIYTVWLTEFFPFRIRNYRIHMDHLIDSKQLGQTTKITHTEFISILEALSEPLYSKFKEKFKSFRREKSGKDLDQEKSQKENPLLPLNTHTQ